MSQLISMPYPTASLSSLSVSWWSSSMPRSSWMSSANHELQSSRPPLDTDDSGVSISSASSAASSAKQSFFHGLWGVEAFYIISSRNILNSTGDNGRPSNDSGSAERIILPALPLSFERNLRHFHLFTKTDSACSFIVRRRDDFNQPAVHVLLS